MLYGKQILFVNGYLLKVLTYRFLYRVVFVQETYKQAVKG